MLHAISSLSYTQNGSTNEPTNSHGLSLIHRRSDTPEALPRHLHYTVRSCGASVCGAPLVFSNGIDDQKTVKLCVPLNIYYNRTTEFVTFHIPPIPRVDQIPVARGRLSPAIRNGCCHTRFTKHLVVSWTGLLQRRARTPDYLSLVAATQGARLNGPIETARQYRLQNSVTINIHGRTTVVYTQVGQMAPA